jgi:hypothetical protein
MRVVSSIRTWTPDNHGNSGVTHACNSPHQFHLLVYLPPCYLSIALHTVQLCRLLLTIQTWVVGIATVQVITASLDCVTAARASIHLSATLGSFVKTYSVVTHCKTAIFDCTRRMNETPIYGRLLSVHFIIPCPTNIHFQKGR